MRRMLEIVRMRNLSRLVKAAVSAAFFYLLYRWVRGHDFADIIRGADPVYLFLSLLILPVLLSVSCAKWKVLLDAQGCVVPFRDLIRYYLIGYYFSNILPSNVGGDIVRLYYAGRRIGSHGHAAASIFLERFTGILLLLALVVFAPLLQPSLYHHPAIWIPALGAAGLLVLFALMMRVRNPLTWFFKKAAEWTGSRLSGDPSSRRPAFRNILLKLDALFQQMIRKAESFHDKLALGASVLRTNRSVLVKVIVLTFLFYILAGVNVWLAFRTFGPAPPVWEIIAALPTAMTVAMIPITLGSLGITETSYVFFFGLIGVAKVHTVAMALFLRLKVIILGLTGLIVYLSHGEKFRRDQARESAD